MSAKRRARNKESISRASKDNRLRESSLSRLRPSKRTSTEGYVSNLRTWCFCRHLGPAYQSQGQVDRAIRVLRKATHSIPDNPALHFNLGILLDRRNRRNEAVQELRAALQLDPNSTHVRSALESILTRGN